MRLPLNACPDSPYLSSFEPAPEPFNPFIPLPQSSSSSSSSSSSASLSSTPSTLLPSPTKTHPSPSSSSQTPTQHVPPPSIMAPPHIQTRGHPPEDLPVHHNNGHHPLQDEGPGHHGPSKSTVAVMVIGVFFFVMVAIVAAAVYMIHQNERRARSRLPVANRRASRRFRRHHRAATLSDPHLLPVDYSKPGSASRRNGNAGVGMGMGMGMGMGREFDRAPSSRGGPLLRNAAPLPTVLGRDYASYVEVASRGSSPTPPSTAAGVRSFEDRFNGSNFSRFGNGPGPAVGSAHTVNHVATPPPIYDYLGRNRA
ncbi:hypothetical protein BS50DRAFT_675568 [Corynespora cassiicola Philippines]|uniref:Uncharacterized protein n=1 Tax=Corynespora cassiicola Philippines TaxID=1448308 RepID=A0A2T2NVJ6_CORCC|nr:hypothetical protein BS50DRAFT_675568 [Corynespora cassiicola Philippines]